MYLCADCGNLFRVYDFPGLNDAQRKFDGQIWKVLSDNMDKFDLLIYMVDCTSVFNKESSQAYFDSMIGFAKKQINLGLLKLMIIFNKFDQIEVAPKKKRELLSIQDNIKKNLSCKHEIKEQYLKKNITMYNIAASRLLVERVILDNDIKFIKRNSDVMDDIYHIVNKN